MGSISTNCDIELLRREGCWQVVDSGWVIWIVAVHFGVARFSVGFAAMPLRVAGGVHEDRGEFTVRAVRRWLTVRVGEGGSKMGSVW